MRKKTVSRKIASAVLAAAIAVSSVIPSFSMEYSEGIPPTEEADVGDESVSENINIKISEEEPVENTEEQSEEEVPEENSEEETEYSEDQESNPETATTEEDSFLQEEGETEEKDLYILLIPEVDGVNYSGVTHIYNELSTGEYKVLVYEESENVSFHIDTEEGYEYRILEADSHSEFLKGTESGDINFIMPPEDLALQVILPDGEEITPDMEDENVEENVSEEDTSAEATDNVSDDLDEEDESFITETESEEYSEPEDVNIQSEIISDAEDEYEVSDDDEYDIQEEETAQDDSEWEDDWDEEDDLLFGKEASSDDTEEIEPVEVVASDAESDMEENPGKEEGIIEVSEEETDDIYEDPDAPVNMQEDFDEFIPGDPISTSEVNELVDESLFPENGSEDYAEAQRIWIGDTGFDYKSYVPEYRFSANVNLSYDHGEIDFSEPDFYNVYYRAEMINIPERSWYVVVPFEVVTEKGFVTVGTDDLDTLIISEQDASYTAPVANKIGETVDGGEYHIQKGTGFDPHFIYLDYDIQLYSAALEDDGGFDPDTEGEYTLLFEVHSRIHPEWIFYVKITAVVEDMTPEEGMISVSVDDFTMTGTVSYTDGSTSDIAYGISAVSEKIPSSITVETYDAAKFDPYISILENGSPVRDNFLISDNGNETSHTYKFDTEKFLKDKGYSIVVKNDLDPVESGFGKSGGAEDADFSTEPTIPTYAAAAKTKTFTNIGAPTAMVSHTTNWIEGNPDTNAYNSAIFTFNSTFINDLKKFMSDNGVTAATDIPSQVGISCIQHDLYGWYNTTDYGYSTATATLYDTNGDNIYDSMSCQVVAYPNPNLAIWSSKYQKYIAYQIFANTFNVSTREDQYNFVIHKHSNAPQFIKDFSFINIDTQFGIYSDKDCKKLIRTVDIQGKTGDEYETVKLPAGTYYMKETGRCPGHKKESQIFGPFKVGYGEANKTGTINNMAYVFNGQIVSKTDEKGRPLAGAYFLVKMYGKAWIFKTDKNGIISYDEEHLVTGAVTLPSDYKVRSVDENLVSNGKMQGLSKLQTYNGTDPGLPEGNLYVREIKAPEGYELYYPNITLPLEGKEYTYVLSVDPAEVVDVSEGEDSFYIQKINYATGEPDVPNTAFYSLKGAKFNVYEDEACTKQIGKTLVTDTSGATKVMVVDLGTAETKDIYIKEIEAPKGFKLNYNVKKITLKKNSKEEREVKFNDAPEVGKGKIYIQKINADTNDATLPNTEKYSFKGAKFNVYEDENCTKQIGNTLTTDESGKTPSLEIELEYESKKIVYIKEIEAPEGFKLSNKVVKATVQRGQASAQAIKFADSPKKGSFKIQKKLDEATADNPNPYEHDLTLIGFRIKSEFDSKLDPKTVYCDSKGVAIFEDLYLGPYTLEEISTVPFHEKGDPVQIVIEDDKEYEYEITNYRPFASIEIHKIDSVTGNMVFLTETSFQIKDYSGNLVTLSPQNAYDEADPPTTTFTTNEEGMVKFADHIPAGKYYLVEVKAPQGYKIADPVEFTVDNNEGTAVITMADSPLVGSAKIIKYDEQTGNRAGAGFSFKIIADEDIKDGSGRTYPGYESGSVIETVTTDHGGEASTTKPLYIGKYHVEEDPESVPEGFTVSDEKPQFEITEENAKAGKPVAVDVTGAELSIHNKPVMIPIEVLKIDADTQKPAGAGFVFEVVADSVLDNTGVARPGFEKGSVVDTITTNTESKAVSKDLPSGNYIIREKTPAPGYELLGEEISVEIKATKDTKPVSVTIKDSPIKKKISVTKLDAKTGNRAGAGYEFQIVANEDIKNPSGDIYAGFEKGSVIETIVTNDEGVAVSSGLYLGKYYIQETKPAQDKGLAINSKKYPFTLTQAEGDETAENLIVDLDAIGDKPTTLIIKKIGAVSGSVLEGVTFELKAKDAETGERYVTDSNGNIKVEYLAKNTTYVLKEVETVKGYNLIDEETEFTVDENGLINGKDTFSVTISNTPNEVHISKRDITNEKELPGAELKITDSDGKVIDEWTSTDEPHIIYELSEGTYRLTEVTAPDNYEVSESVEFTVENSMVVNEVVMYDAPVREVEISKQDISNSEEIPGCTMVISDENGKELHRWVSSEEPHKFKLYAGVYTLTEIQPASGYATAESIVFTVEKTTADDYSVQHVEMKDTPLTINVSKKDITNGEEIPGAELIIKDKDGNVFDEWTSTDTPHVIERIPAGTYTLTEITAPDGYEVAETITFEVKDDETIQHVEMFDSPKREVYISKLTVSGSKEVEGAHLVITDRDGKTIDDWISTKETHVVKLNHGRYTLTETKPADGFVTAESITFDVTERNTEGDNAVQEVKMYDNVTTVEISKQDVTNSKELPGAHLQILDADGNVVHEWTSTDEPHKIEMLPIGEYTLVETTAPNGYAVAESVKFTVADTEEIQHVIMYDSPIVTPPAGTPPTTPSTPTTPSPQTGDTFNVPLAVGIGCGILFLLFTGIILIRRRKKA